MRTDQELLEHVEKVIFDVTVPDHEKVLCIQNLLYQRSAILDHKTESIFGDDDSYPNMRRV